MILLCSLSFANIMTFNPQNNIKESESQNNYAPIKLDHVCEANGAKSNENVSEDGTGCCSVIIHIKHGHDIVSYRRDSGYAANVLIEKINFNGQTAIIEYKTQKGYFCHVIITQNGWIISIGGKDGPNTNEMLEKLGSDIISRGNIENKDLNEANSIIKRNGWGHFVIKSPDDNVGVAIHDSRVSASITKLFKMNDGDYVKVPNTPRYYDSGNLGKYSNNSINAAIQIIGTDPYGVNRRDVITYELINDNISTKVNIWASFDGGALMRGTKGKPDDILFMNNDSLGNNKLKGDKLPTIPNKMFLGEETLGNDNLQDGNSVDFYIIFMILVIMIIAAVFYHKVYK